MPPRTTEKSYRPRVSDRTMVDTQAQPSACPRFRNRPRSLGSAFPLPRSFQNGPEPSRVRIAAPTGAPLTAPDRSEQHSYTRESRDRKPDTAIMAIPTTNQPTSAGGAGCQANCAWSGSEENLFLLTSPFIELSRSRDCLARQSKVDPPRRENNAPASGRVSVLDVRAYSHAAERSEVDWDLTTADHFPAGAPRHSFGTGESLG
jgi:hypothetical protein